MGRTTNPATCKKIQAVCALQHPALVAKELIQGQWGEQILYVLFSW